MADSAGETLGGAIAVAGQLPADLAADLLASTRDAFTAGLITVAWVGTGVGVVLPVVAATVLRRRTPPCQEVR